MNNDLISIVVNGNSYRLSPDDSASIEAIEGADRLQLLALLAAIKLQQEQREAVVQRRLQGLADKSAAISLRNPPGRAVEAKYGAIGRDADQRPMSTAEVDALMAELIMEEKKNAKSGPSKKTIYQWIVYSLIAIIVLIVIN